MRVNIPEHVRRVFIHFGFPLREWGERYRVDFSSGQANRRAHRVYLAIAESLKMPSSENERERLRYYQRKIKAERGRVSTESHGRSHGPLIAK